MTLDFSTHRNWSTECECGRPKPSKRDACDRCQYLDGHNKGKHGLIIAALRGSSGMSVRELCEALGNDGAKRNGYRSTQRAVYALLANGRLRRYMRDGEARPSPGFGMGGGAGGDCWVYVLSGRSDR